VTRRSPQERLDTNLPVIDSWLRKGKLWHAREMVPQMRACVEQLSADLQPEYDAAVRQREDALAKRIAEHGAPAEWDVMELPAQEAKAPSPEFSCKVCGARFHALEWQPTCDLCVPEGRISVRTLPGGLPGLGRRR